jgi:hypothetical protein
VTGGWKKLDNKELPNMYPLPIVIRMIKVKEDEMGKAHSMNGEKRNAQTTRKTKM